MLLLNFHAISGRIKDILLLSVDILYNQHDLTATNKICNSLEDIIENTWLSLVESWVQVLMPQKTRSAKASMYIDSVGAHSFFWPWCESFESAGYPFRYKRISGIN
ncbi:hypothetical protein TNCV_4724461 [Trichonephila clavipes]|uniref:Uncharacterized protein n=1 Tax=Trichonephila clavipes TaxID=2585209 RepID=A0A8X6W6Q3_TRICX|nr:hypothetical protein TNCV_4724461 [Trichonephila clavipes]